MASNNSVFDSSQEDIAYAQQQEGYETLSLQTDRGSILTRWYHALKAGAAVIYVGGVGGDFDTPANGLYPRLCRELVDKGIDGLRIQYRNPLDLPQAIYDVVAGIAFLESRGIEDIGLVGHSFGGAVVIRAGTLVDSVRTVVTLATQSHGAQEAAHLHKPLLMVHGSLDEILAPASSRYIFRIAREPKKLVFYESATHMLNEAAEEVFKLVREWLLEKLA